MNPFRFPAFRAQYLALAVTTIGGSLSPVALALGLLREGTGVGVLGVLLAANAVPTIAFLMIGGVWADRLPRYLVMIASNVLAGACQLVLGIMFLTHHFALGPAIAAQLLSGTAMAFYFPASSGLTATTVPPESLQRANALLSLLRSTANTFGPVLAGLLVITVGAGWGLVADGVSFLLSSLVLLRLRRLAAAPTPRADADAGRESFRAQLVQGFRAVRHRPWVWTSIVGFMFTHLATGLLMVMGPAEISARPDGAVGWGVVVGAIGAGQVLGDLIVLRIAPARPLVISRLVELLGVPLLVLIAFDAPLPFLVLAAVAAGAALTLPDSLWFTALQRHLPEEVLSRVSSYDWMGSLALRPIGYAAAGALAVTAGIRWSLVGAALLVVATRLLALTFRDVRHLPLHRDPQPDVALAERAA